MTHKKGWDNGSQKGGSSNANGKSSSRSKGKFKPPNNRSKNPENGNAGPPKQRGSGPLRKEEAAGSNDQPAANPNRGGAKRILHNIDPFQLFCAYHLGIGVNNEYKPSNINEVAKRFGVDPATTRQVLKEYGMDSGSLLDLDFDMALAQLDIQVAPEGIDRTELAKSIYDEFLNAPVKTRDWKKILEEDRKENAKVFGGR